jgi:Holliday junction resolvase RusA-like endonuclease
MGQEITKQAMGLWVSGVEPAPQGSKRYVGGNHASGGRFIEASKKLAPFREAIAAAVKIYLEQNPDFEMFTEPVIVSATFVMPRHKTVKRLWPSVAPDTDKLQRALGEAISLPKYGQLMTDDSLIVQWHAQKIYSQPGEMGVYFQIEPAVGQWRWTKNF